MDVSVSEAVDALRTTVNDLLPGIADPALVPDVHVHPVKTHLAGIGGVIGKNASPVGEIGARRVKARVIVRVKADNVAGLLDREMAVTSALTGASTISLRTLGIYRLTRDSDFESTVLGPGDGLAVGAGKDIRFDLDYEFRKVPDASGAVITDLPVDLVQQTTDNTALELYRSEFLVSPLADFDAIDDGSATGGPGSWTYDAINQSIVQTSAISGGSNNFNASKRGTYLTLRTAVAPPQRDFVLHASMSTGTSGGIGLVFRFQDANNYYFFLMNRPSPYRLFGKKVADSLSFLASDGRDATVGYEPGRFHNVRLAAQGDTFDLAIDGVTALTGHDGSITEPGAIGFMSRNNSDAQFRFLRWVGL